MLKKRYRALPRGVFNKSFASRFFLLKIRDNGLLYSRFGFVISKKIDKRAVVRNRLRRILSSCLEEIFDRIKQGYDMVFVIKKDMVGKNRKEILNSVSSLLAKEDFLK